MRGNTRMSVVVELIESEDDVGTTFRSVSIRNTPQQHSESLACCCGVLRGVVRVAHAQQTRASARTAPLRTAFGLNGPYSHWGH